MSEKPQLSITLPTLVVVSGTASGLGTHIANQLVDCGVTTIGVDIAARPNGNARRRSLRTRRSHGTMFKTSLRENLNRFDSRTVRPAPIYPAW